MALIQSWRAFRALTPCAWLLIGAVELSGPARRIHPAKLIGAADLRPSDILAEIRRLIERRVLILTETAGLTVLSRGERWRSIPRLIRWLAARRAAAAFRDFERLREGGRQ